MVSSRSPNDTSPLLSNEASWRAHSNGVESPDAQQSAEETLSHYDTLENKRRQSWTHAQETNFWGKLFTTYYSFTLVGGIDGAYGVLIHYFRQYYHIDYLGVSVILLSPVVGYTIAALINEKVHKHFGQRGIAILGPGCHTIAFILVALRPPYPLLVALCILVGLGSGLIDAGWNAWIGAMPNSSGLLGALHAFYGLGAAITPVIVTSLIEKAGWEWYHFYYLLTGVAATELCTSVLAFWSATGAQFLSSRSSKSDPHDEPPSSSPESNHDALPQPSGEKEHSLLHALKKPSTWIVSLFIFLYAGVELALADWIFALLVDSRHEPELTGSAITFAYWGGLTMGRVVIGFLIPVFRSEKHHVTVLLAFVLTFQLIFMFTTNLPLTAIALPLLGFFHGPLFPEAVIMQTKLLPKQLHVSAVGFSCALGSAGGCVMPFIIGAIANKSSIEVLNPALTIMIVVMIVLWLSLPRPSTRNTR